MNTIRKTLNNFFYQFEYRIVGINRIVVQSQIIRSGLFGDTQEAVFFMGTHILTQIEEICTLQYRYRTRSRIRFKQHQLEFFNVPFSITRILGRYTSLILLWLHHLLTKITTIQDRRTDTGDFYNGSRGGQTSKQIVTDIQYIQGEGTDI